MFDQQVKKADMRAVFTENARNMNLCGPCAADPLSHEELPSLGVFGFSEAPPDFIPGRGHRPIVPPLGGARDVFVARMLQPDEPFVPLNAESPNPTLRQGWQNLWTS